MVLIDHITLNDFAASLLHKGGFTKEESDITAKSLILSNLMGHDSHGLIRVKEYVDCLGKGEIVSGVDLKIIKETPTSLQTDGQFGLGQVQMPRVLEKLYPKLKDNGVVSASILNCGHVGRLGEWVEAAAVKGFAAFMTVNDNGVFTGVAPAGGKQGRTSTNPLAFAIPLQDHQYFSIDLSTSAIAMGKLRLAHLAGKDAPEGVIQDHQGLATTNTTAIFEEPKGSVLPFGGYKGFALSMMVDCLSAGLSGGFTPPAPDGTVAANCVTITLWNPAHFAGLDHMQFQAEKYLGFVKSSEAIDPEKPVRAPGDRARSTHDERIKNGIPFDPAFWDMMMKYAEKIGVDRPKAA